MLRLAFDFIITWRETRTRPNAYPYFYEDKSDKIIDDDTLARLLSFNNVIVTSHQAFFTKEAMTNIAHTTLQNVKDFAESRSLVNEVAVGRV